MGAILEKQPDSNVRSKSFVSIASGKQPDSNVRSKSSVSMASGKQPDSSVRSKSSVSMASGKDEETGGMMAVPEDDVAGGMMPVPEMDVHPQPSNQTQTTKTKSAAGNQRKPGNWRPSHMFGRQVTGWSDPISNIVHDLSVEPTLRRNLDVENDAGAEIERHIDPSLLFGMERTLNSALNLGVTMTFFGLGLMMVSNIDRKKFFAQGCTMASFCLLYMVFSWVTHLHRMQMLRRGQPVSTGNSTVWTGSLIFLMCLCVGLELIYAYYYPYMERSMPVDVNPTPGPVVTTATPP